MTMDRVDFARRALAEAIEGMEEMIPYVSEYFVDKWGLQAYIESAKSALAELSEEP